MQMHIPIAATVWPLRWPVRYWSAGPSNAFSPRHPASRPHRTCRQSSRCNFSSAASTGPEAKSTHEVAVRGRQHATDDWFNVPVGVLDATARLLHQQRDHPLCLARQLIEAQFPAPKFRHHADLDPVVSVAQNFDDLDFPADHPGRARSETYYLSRSSLLRTHTSAHQLELFRAASAASPGFTLAADVYRRDAIDRSHYPVFHQMEGALTWDRDDAESAGLPSSSPLSSSVADAIWRDFAALPIPDLPGSSGPGVGLPFDPVRNPRQASDHSEDETRAVAAHLRRSLELMVVAVFSRAQQLSAKAFVFSSADPLPPSPPPLQVRWVDAYFPFTSPSWELEVLHNGQWLEVLGCGVVRQSLLDRAGGRRLGWAFGLGLDRIAMLLLGIPDIRLFWSRDRRFLDQFAAGRLSAFVPFSVYPPCYKDVSFWLPGPVGAVKLPAPHHHDVMELVRGVAADLVEDVSVLDEFVHPTSRQRSRCYRITYRSLERTMTNTEVLAMHAEVCSRLERQLGVVIR